MGYDFSQSGPPPEYGDLDLTRRIVAAYRGAIQTPLGTTDSMWLHGPLLDMRRDVHDALLDDDTTTIEGMLQDPGETNLLHGFEDLSKTFATETLPCLDREAFATSVFLGLVQLARAVGSLRLTLHGHAEPALPDTEDVLIGLNRPLGLNVMFPNPFPGEAGLATTRGICSYRAPPAIYQAHRVAQLVGGVRRPRILEIGAGLGRTAFYARQLGVLDYTIVDLPISLVAQANFLGRTIGAENIQLYGEQRQLPDGVKLLPPAAFLAADDRYDLILNVDSLTEMSPETAQAYCTAIHDRARTFLSINHEGLTFTVAGLMRGGVLQRSPYWMRPGYVEELIGRFPLSGRAEGALARVQQFRKRWVG